MTDTDYLVTRMKSPFPMKGIERRIYAAYILTVLSGVLLSVALKDWQFFERSGSLIVIIGMIVTFKDFAGQFQSFEEYFKSQVASSDVDNVGKIFRLARKRLLAIEIFILISGTVIWGYGSFIENIFEYFTT